MYDTLAAPKSRLAAYGDGQPQQSIYEAPPAPSFENVGFGPYGRELGFEGLAAGGDGAAMQHYAPHSSGGLKPIYYKSIIEVGGKPFRLIKEDPHYFPANVLAWTDTEEEIHLRNNLGYHERFVLEHEKSHIEMKQRGEHFWDEDLVDNDAMRKCGLTYRPV
jgi:hypothetical protein